MYLAIAGARCVSFRTASAPKMSSCLRNLSRFSQNLDFFEIMPKMRYVLAKMLECGKEGKIMQDLPHGFLTHNFCCRH